jgi:lysophospholipase L1-like esterase
MTGRSDRLSGKRIFFEQLGSGYLATIVLLTVLFGGCGKSGEASPESEPDPGPSNHLVSTHAGSGGSISPGSQDVLHGDIVEFTVATDDGYGIKEVTGCNGSLSGSTYTTGAITGACTVTASFGQNRYTISAAGGSGGVISPSSQNVMHGGRTEFTVSADSGYRIRMVSGCGGSLSGNIFLTGVITEACTVSAHFLPILAAPAEDLIIDNTEPNGKWELSYSPYPYGASSLYSKEKDASYTFKAQASGLHDLYMWWTQAADRSTAIPVKIYDGEAPIDTVIIDQQRNGGRWNWLGSYYFSDEARIVIISPGSQSTTCADAVRLVPLAGVGPRVALTFPASRHLQTSPDLIAMADARHLGAGSGVRFLLDGEVKSIDSYLPPFVAVFEKVPRGEHTIDALVIDGQGLEVVGPDAHSRASQIGIGGYYVGMGDSITWGAGDDTSSDNTSLDGRDGPRGYQPVLNDLLTGRRKFPHRIANEGIGGNHAKDGKDTIHALLGKHPDALAFLVLYGTNDSHRTPYRVPSGLGLLPTDPGYDASYKDNMQQIINAIKGAGKGVFLAKVPVTLGEASTGYQFPDPQSASRNKLIREYNEVVDELVDANGIIIPPPDFYAYFTGVNPATGNYRYQEEYFDNLHPNGLGYRSMAKLWEEAIASTSLD